MKGDVSEDEDASDSEDNKDSGRRGSLPSPRIGEWT